MAVSGFFRRASSAGWSISITGCATTTRRWWCKAYETWGFRNLTRELIDILNIWARFIYGPLLDDRVRSIADGVKPGEYGRREAFRVHQALKEKGPVTVPREFVFMDRAAIGLGGVFLHLRAELNFYRLFNEAIENFSIVARWQPGRPRRSTGPVCRRSERPEDDRIASRFPPVALAAAIAVTESPRSASIRGLQWLTTAKWPTRPRTATTTRSTSRPI